MKSKKEKTINQKYSYIHISLKQNIHLCAYQSIKIEQKIDINNVLCKNTSNYISETYENNSCR